MIPSLDTRHHRESIRQASRKPAGRTHLATMLTTNRDTLASLDRLKAAHADLPDDTSERAILKRNVELLEKALGELAA